MTQVQVRRLAILQAVAMAAIAAIILIASATGSDRQGMLTEEFHKVYPLSAQGRVEIENINGPVHITEQYVVANIILFYKICIK